jgi:hypothetical protein
MPNRKRDLRVRGIDPDGIPGVRFRHNRDRY